MNPPPFPHDPQQQTDTSHLNLLGIFHFICGGLSFLGLGFLVLHYLMMQAVFANPDMWKNTPNPPPPQFFEIFMAVYLVIGGFLLVGLVLNVMSGVFLRRRKHRTFSICVAALNCLNIPLGTTLGVFTLIVLLRDSVRRSYETGQN
jgi:uncharacterized BrkB/YihY/UPF0761 family membrane protein